MNKTLKTENSFLKNVLTLMTGTAFAQILPILTSPILTRLYTPEEFGEFGIFIAILGVISVIGCLRYELAIALPKEDKDAINIAALSLIVTAIISSILILSVVILAFLPERIESLNNLFPMILIIPFAVLVTNVYQVLLNWNIRMKNFKKISITQIYKSSAVVSGQVGFGFLKSIPSALILSHFIGQLISVLVLLKSSLNTLISNKKHINIKSIKLQMFKYNKFPKYYSLSALLNTASVQMPIIMLGIFFNPVIVGYYTLANRVLAAPISIIGTAIAQPYLQRATEEHRKNNLGDFSFRIFEKLLAFGLVPIILISIVSPELFIIIFGSKWEVAGVYVQLISIWLLFVFISSPLSHIYTVLELQKASLNFNAMLFITRAAVLILGGTYSNDFFTILWFGLTGAVLWLFQIIWLLNKAGIKVKIILRTCLQEFIYSVPFIISPIILKFIIGVNGIPITIITVICLISFFVIKFKVKINNK